MADTQQPRPLRVEGRSLFEMHISRVRGPKWRDLTEDGQAAWQATAEQFLQFAGAIPEWVRRGSAPMPLRDDCRYRSGFAYTSTMWLLLNDGNVLRGHALVMERDGEQTPHEWFVERDGANAISLRTLGSHLYVCGWAKIEPPVAPDLAQFLAGGA